MKIARAFYEKIYMHVYEIIAKIAKNCSKLFAYKEHPHPIGKKMILHGKINRKERIKFLHLSFHF